MPLIKQERDFAGFFPSAYLLRGRHCFQEGLVIALDILRDDASSLELYAEVQGTDLYPYEVAIGFSVAGGKKRMVSQCTCPISINCKHGAATLFAYLAQESPNYAKEQKRQQLILESRRIEAWLTDTLQQQHAPAEDSEQLRFLLKYSSVAAPLMAWTLEPVLVKPLKRGGWSKPKAISLHNWHYRRAAALDTEQAQRLMSYAVAAANHNPQDRLFLHGASATVALEQVLQSGLCHYVDMNNPPLQLSAPRTASPSWQRSGDGRQSIRMCEQAWLVLPTSPPYALDPATAEIFALETGLPPAIAASLCIAPSISEELAEQVVDQIAIHLPNLPKPQVKTSPDTRTDILPKAELRLSGLLLEAGRSPYASAGQLYFAELHFHYGELVIPSDHEAATLSDGTIKIRRDRVAEIALQTRLEENLRALAGQLPYDWRPMLPSALWGLPRINDWLYWLAKHQPRLIAEGWKITIEPGFDLRLHEAESWYTEVDEKPDQDWFQLKLGVEVDGQRYNLLPALVEYLKQGPNSTLTDDVVVPGPTPGSFLHVPRAKVKALADTLVELHSATLGSQGELKMPNTQGYRLEQLGSTQWLGGERLRATINKLKQFQGLQPLATPPGFTAELRPYQQLGLTWLQFLREFGFNGILADDMGLGKTLQTLAHILMEKQAGRLKQAALVIAPTSLVANWRSEAARFAPQLRTLVLHGSGRHGDFSRIAESDLVITTYPLLARDSELLTKTRFHLLILDEAQVIKNPKAKAAALVRELDAQHRLCLTGTPMENHLGELWALMDFLMPGLLGSAEQFRKLYRKPIENDGDNERRVALTQRIAPFMLRRRKQEVVADLPPKTEITRTIALEGKQRELYESVRLSVQEELRKVIAAQGLGRSQIMVLDALLKLRQVCCSPRLLKLDSAKEVSSSAKLEYLLELLPQLIEEGRRILLFSQFTQMLSLIEEAAAEAGIAYVKLTGQTKDRETPVQRFQQGEVPLFLISLKAGGTGLNLTAADTVILYDPWWNPAAEAQAADRAHRIGQDKPVFVYRLVSEDTVEEKILQMQERKKSLADGIYGQGQTASAAITAEDLEALLKPLE